MSNIDYATITDFVIPLHRYHFMVRTVIEAIHNFYSPRTIYIVTPKKFSNIIMKSSKDWLVKNIVVIPEETFFISNYKMHYNDIKNKFNNNYDPRSREFGWWYQQLIKLGAYKQIKNLSDPYVVWDSDLIPLIKWNIYPTIDNNSYKIAILQEKARSEWNTEQYKKSLFDLTKLNITDPDEGTFVTHHFVFYHNVLNGLFNHIELISGESWIDSIMTASHKHFRFSEYRTVASFMKYRFSHLLNFYEFKEFGHYGIRIREPKLFLKEMNEFLGELYEISYNDFVNFTKHKYKYLPSYLQIEHI